MPSFDHADATLAAGPPFLAVAEPTLLLLAFALRALGGAVGDADALDALGFRGRLVLGRVEAGIRRHQVRRAAQRCLMRFDRGKQQVRVAGPPIVDFVGDDDLVLRLLQFDDFAEFGGLAGLAFPNNFSGRLEQADNLVLGVGVAGEDARIGLAHHLPHARHHAFQLPTQPPPARPAAGCQPPA